LLGPSQQYAPRYFEWLDEGPKPKFEITIPGREYFGIAGVYGPCLNPKTEKWETTFSAFTSEPNALIQRSIFVSRSSSNLVTTRSDSNHLSGFLRIC
jgi:hypothetical protein